MQKNRFPVPRFSLSAGDRCRRLPVMLALLVFAAAPLAAARYTRLLPLPAPRIVGSAEAVLVSGNNPVENLVDGNPNTEYASAGKGLDTFVEFDFGAPTPIAGFRHQDRKNGTIAGSELIFYDEAGREIRRLAITHPDRSGAVTFKAIWPAITARRVRWQVTKLGRGNAGAVGGAEITFFQPGPAAPVPQGLGIKAVALPVATAEAGVLHQPLRLTIDYPYAEPSDAVLRVTGLSARALRLVAGPQTVQYSIPIADAPRQFSATIEPHGGGTALATHAFDVPAFRKLTVYVLPHSHVDIGFTEIQSAIAEKQLNNLLIGMSAAQRTAGYPKDARFVWNLEGLWPADLLQQRLGAQERQALAAAVREGHVALDGMYFNTLTGLCRPEDLIQLFRFGTRLKEELGVPLDSAMISDVPGYTWGTVTAMAQAGIKYFSAAPNIFDRIGDTYVQWENKPFWWIGPDGRDRVLVWVPMGGYNLAARIGAISPEWVESMAEELVRTRFPYDIMYIRWSRGDNAAPDARVSDEVRAWNAAHPWPHFVIGTVHEAFSAMARKYGAQLPQYRGDWTGYWSDGAGSSARETAMNRANSDRLTEAEALWAMQGPGSFPAGAFSEARRQVLLYNEHTWGASSAITNPDGQPERQQWAVKRGYAETADNLSRELLARALALSSRGPTATAAVDVYNPSSWTRSGLAVLTRDMSATGNRVTDAAGAPVPSQRLRNGELVIYARDVPPYAARRYTVSPGAAYAGQRVTMTATTLDNGLVHVAIDPNTGAISELRPSANGANLVDSSSGEALNSYLYFNGDDPSKARGAGAVTIRVGEQGPLVASLVVDSHAPGTYLLSREVKLVAGDDAVHVCDLVDKRRLVAKDYRAPDGKESVNFAFPFAVPGGQMRLEVPFGVIRPDRDQIPGACKNWFTIDRWADVSNDRLGVTLVSLDAPLVEVGGLTAHLLNSQTNPAVWRHSVAPTQKLYAWVMNNHWGTNYRAYQEGPVAFRFLIRPHGAYDPVAASQVAIAASQPLRAVRAHGAPPSGQPRLTVDSPEVIVTALKPSDDRRALIVRLWAAGEHDVKTRLHWAAPEPTRVWLSDTSEEPLHPAGDEIEIPAWGLVTLRAELP